MQLAVNPENVVAIAVFRQVQPPLGGAAADGGEDGGGRAATVAPGAENGVAVEHIGGLCGHKILSHYRQPSRQIRRAGAAGNPAIANIFVQNPPVQVPEGLRLLGVLPLVGVRSVDIIHQKRARVVAVKLAALKLRQEHGDVLVVKILHQVFRIAEITVRKVRRHRGAPAAAVPLGNFHQLLRTQNLRIAEDSFQCQLLGAAKLTVQHILLVRRQTDSHANPSSLRT